MYAHEYLLIDHMWADCSDKKNETFPVSQENVDDVLELFRAAGLWMCLWRILCPSGFPPKKENNPKEVNFYARSLEPRLSASPARHR